MVRGYVYFENEPGRRSAAKLLSKKIGVRSLNSVQQLVVGWANIRLVLMREHTLTGWHVQQLSQRAIVCAENFLIDDAGFNCIAIVINAHT